jgi:predicted amidohydrolase
MRIAFLQMNCRFGEVEENLAKAQVLLEPAQADLFVLPELFNTGYLFQAGEELEHLAEPAEGGRTSAFLIGLASTKKCHIVAGIAEKSRDGIYNSCLLVGPNGYITTYRKIHLFRTEKEWFVAGTEPFFVVDIGAAKIGKMICFDWIFPESMRSLALLGADIICHPANLVLPYCQSAMVTRCLENSVYAVTANRIGTDVRANESLTFTGKSQITGPRGEILATATENEECVRIVDIDVEQARDKRINPYNDLRKDRRRELYAL